MLKIIVAHDKNRVIGNGIHIPWHIKEDFLHYKNTTMGHTMIMGKTTFESIGKPLPGRKTIVLDFNKNYDAQGCEVCTDYMELVKRYEHSQDVVFVCGGASIYRLFLPYCEELIVSLIKGEYVGNVFFPEYEDNFVEYKEENHEQFVVKYYKKR